MDINKIYCGDSVSILKTFPSESVNCCITSPPYFGLRDYKVDGQIGLEQTPEEYVAKLVEVFREVRRVLKDDGTLWLNLGDSYAGSGKGGQSKEKRSENWQPEYGNKGYLYGLKPKDLIGIPWLVAFALRSDGWYLRQDIIWNKTNPMPESVKDRCTKSHEYVFLLTKSSKYYFDYENIQEIATGYDGRKDTMFKGAIKSYDGVMPNGQPQSFAQNGHERWKYKNLQEDGQQPNTMHLKRLVGDEYMSPVRNKRSVWTVSTRSFKEAHFATFPEELISPMIKAGCPEGGIVLDPFMGAGTTGLVAKKQNKNYVGIDLNPEYCAMATKRINDYKVQMKLNETI